ncbi:MAG TPA: helix-turn-helix domain-containing protein [Nocardioidaceae bacterium]|nr:helix-turn-helix domain-containing protein [Nocardioidaceae bacterium]
MTNTHHAGEPVRPALSHAGDELLTLKEVADLLRVPEATLRYWRHLGTGPRGFRLGRSVRYWRTDLTLWLTEQTNRPRDQR